MKELKEPEMKTKLAIDWSDKDQRVIYFFTDEEIAKPLKKFGSLNNSGTPNKYRLSVDGRFDFKEVLEYVTAYSLSLE